MCLSKVKMLDVKRKEIKVQYKGAIHNWYKRLW